MAEESDYLRQRDDDGGYDEVAIGRKYEQVG